MPTIVTKTVIPAGGGDYSSLSSAESGEQAIRADLVSRDEQLLINCSGSTADTTGMTWDGFTTDATRNVVITGDLALTKYSTSYYRLEASSSTGVIQVSDPWVEFHRIQVSNSHTSGGGFRGSATGGTMKWNRCIAKTTGANKTGTGFLGQGTSTTNLYSNCLAYDFSGTGGMGINTTGATNVGKIYNCTVQNCATGFNASSGTPIIKNSLAQNCTDGFAGSWNAGSDYNCSDVSSDAPGANSQTGSATFVDAAGDDFALTSADTVAYNLGTSLSGDSTLPITVDIIGTARPQSSAYDIGFHEVIVSAGTRRIFTIT